MKRHIAVPVGIPNSRAEMRGLCGKKLIKVTALDRPRPRFLLASNRCGSCQKIYSQNPEIFGTIFLEVK